MSTKRQLNDGERLVGTPYRVVRLIGLGGMGCVYEVEHEELGKRFVLKALLSDLASRADLVQRMRTEWRALGRLEHPNIVRVSDAGLADGGQPYYVMELLRGVPLSEAMKRRVRFPVDEALRVAIAVLDGLGAAHEIGIVHRDVKPPNIFLCTDGVARLLDFGIAKFLDVSMDAITARGVAVGTPRYMSPEQAGGSSVDARADLYAVGLVLFEMLTGAGPYRAADANEMFLAHLTQPAPLISTRIKGVLPELDQFVASLLSKAPGDRPASAKQAAERLREILKLQLASTSQPASTRTRKDSTAGSQSDLSTLIGDVQQILDCQTRRVDLAPVEKKKSPPLPKFVTTPELQSLAGGDRAAEHTLFLNEAPLPVSTQAAESTLTSVATADNPIDPTLTPSGKSRALRRVLFPIGVAVAVVVALLLAAPRRRIEPGEVPVSAVATVAPPVVPAPMVRSAEVPIVAETPTASPNGADAGGPGPRSGSSDKARRASGVKGSAVAASNEPQARKMPNPKLFSEAVAQAPAKTAADAPGKASPKASSLPPSGL